MKRVLLGMSGGVDSSVAAYLLQKEGYEVVGATMDLWDFKNESKDTSIEDAKAVCKRLNIDHYVLDFKDDFKGQVVDNFIDEYFEGKTPNPCVFCNKTIKFGLLFDKAKDLGCDYVATGHYALVEFNETSGKYEIRKASSDSKDQTYVLYNLNQEKLAKTLFPIGRYDKNTIRQIAKEIGLEVHNKPDSQDICFIPDHDYEGFLKENSNKKIEAGNFVDKSGKILGKHKGIISYTIGQRKGLGITFGRPTYVIDINGQDKSIVLGDNDDLFKTSLTARDVNFVEWTQEEVSGPIGVYAKVRYAAKPAKAEVTYIGQGLVRVDFEEPQRAITSGQSVVFYSEDRLLGGGIIE